MFSCDYNGWADVPEDEREALEAFEAGPAPTDVQPAGRLPLLPAVVPVRLSTRRAA
jgi:hypothetical protein